MGNPGVTFHCETKCARLQCGVTAFARLQYSAVLFARFQSSTADAISTSATMVLAAPRTALSAPCLDVFRNSDGVKPTTAHQCAECGSQLLTTIQLTICWQHSHTYLPSCCLGLPPSCCHRAQYATSSAHAGLMHNLLALCRSTP